MELKLKIGYQDVLNLVRQLSVSELLQLKTELNSVLTEKKSKQEQLDFQELLLNGPVMNEEQHQRFLKHRKVFNQWRVN